MSELSLARIFDSPVFLARQMCSHCHGGGTVPTPAMAGWTAAVERVKDDILARTSSSAEAAAYDSARRVVGDPPKEASATCQGCDGQGYDETEVSIDELRELLDAQKRPTQPAAQEPA